MACLDPLAWERKGSCRLDYMPPSKSRYVIILCLSRQIVATTCIDNYPFSWVNRGGNSRREAISSWKFGRDKCTGRIDFTPAALGNKHMFHFFGGMQGLVCFIL